VELAEIELGKILVVEQGNGHDLWMSGSGKNLPDARL